ncbi:hypothetical protein TNCV_2640071 [Trichonephila clavipes]|nr:hypothetical protein TNCV_2640071 [Trichonephila clavipes]
MRNHTPTYAVITQSHLWRKLEAESISERDEIGNEIEEVVDLARQINLEVDNDDIQDLVDSHNKELIIDELMEMYKQEPDIKEFESLHPVQSEDRMTVDNMLTKYKMIKFIDFCEVWFLPESEARVAAIVGDHRCHTSQH